MVRDFIAELVGSGYSREQTREIVTAGLKGYEDRRRREESGGTPIHGHKKQTQKGRDLRKLLEQNTWFNNREPQEIGDREPGPSRGRRVAKRPNKDPVAVMFVP